MKLAVLGASGFIGSRVVEMLHLRGEAEVRPVVRSASGLARSARFDLDGRVADARDEAAMRTAFGGCEVVVHAVAGDLATVTETLAPAYAAAAAAGVRRLIYLSSTSVHGQAPSPGTDERTPLSEEQPLPYNTAKVRAERTLTALRASGNVEVVVLRPGIVHGPRSRWTAGWADDVLARRAYLVGDGDGICNSIYVDNLVHAIRLVASAPAQAVDGEAFLVSDRELVTWAELLRPIAESLGVEWESIPRVTYDEGVRQRTDWWARLNVAKESRTARSVLSLFPSRLRFAVYSGLEAWRHHRPNAVATPRSVSAHATPTATKEMALLHACRYKLPSTKAESAFDYRPPIALDEARRRSIAWLAFAGYPVVEPRP